MQERLRQPGDLGRHRGGEEQRLPSERHELADLLDVRDEAHVEHPVGLVDDEDLDAGQQEFAALREVEQAAGRGDQHVGAARDLGFLVAEGDAADQQRDVDLVIDAVAVERLFDLGREFARRLEDQRARHPRPGTAGLEPRDHRQGEGGGLARAGLGDTQDVPAFERVGDRLFLDGSRRGVAGRLYGLQDLVAEAEFVEVH